MTNEVKLGPIPDSLVKPSEWTKEAINRAAEYAGLPESTIFLAEARRYMALEARIEQLERDVRRLQIDTVRLK